MTIARRVHNQRTLTRTLLAVVAVAFGILVLGDGNIGRHEFADAQLGESRGVQQAAGKQLKCNHTADEKKEEKRRNEVL